MKWSYLAIEIISKPNKDININPHYSVVFLEKNTSIDSAISRVFLGFQAWAGTVIKKPVNPLLDANCTYTVKVLYIPLVHSSSFQLPYWRSLSFLLLVRSEEKQHLQGFLPIGEYQCYVCETLSSLGEEKSFLFRSYFDSLKIFVACTMA